jgi:hypothetical protein
VKKAKRKREEARRLLDEAARRAEATLAEIGAIPKPRRERADVLSALGRMAGAGKPGHRALATHGKGAREVSPWTLPVYPPGVLPGGATDLLAMDDAGGAAQWNAIPPAWLYGAVSGTGYHGMWAEGIGFMGYPYLAELTQRAEYRRPSEVMAEEMTREGFRINASGDDDKTERVKVIEEKLKEFNVAEVLRSAVEFEGFFGRSQVYPDLGPLNDDTIKTPLLLRPEYVGKGSLKGFRAIDPTWTAPNDYDATDPTRADFYKPQTWFITARLWSASRLLTMNSRPVPDILKPAYNFGGLSLSQMLKPYVDNWLRTRQAVSDLLYAFTVFVLSTDLNAQLAGEGEALGPGTNETTRAQAFVMARDNLGLMMINKDLEEFQNVSAPLGGLDHLQAQAQEHMAAVAAIPIVKLFGITPSGLMATADGEIRTFYDTVKARQKKVLSPILDTIVKLIQLSEFGNVDPAIGHEWVPLYRLDAAGEASVRKTDADTDAVLIQAAVISPEESRTRLAADATSPYHGLEGPPPEPPAAPPEGGGGLGADPSERVDSAAEGGAKTGANAADEAPPFSFDAEFKEGDHPRGQPENAGQFGPGGNSDKTSPDAPENVTDPIAAMALKKILSIKYLPGATNAQKVEKLGALSDPEDPSVASYLGSLKSYLAWGGNYAPKQETLSPELSRPAAIGYEPHTESQKNIYADLEMADPVRENIAFEVDGRKILYKRDTGKIPADWYEKVTSAYADGAEPLSNDVDAAMSGYANAVDLMLTKDEDSAVWNYKGSGYDEIRKRLLGKKKNVNDAVEKNISDLKSAINKTALPADTVLYRGFRASLKKIAGIDLADAVGKSFVHKNFASFSRDDEVAAEFGGSTMMKVTIKAGTPALVLGEQNGGEREVLIDCNSVFKIDKIKKVGSRNVIFVTYLGTSVDE